jgi:hypothetical protein
VLTVWVCNFLAKIKEISSKDSSKILVKFTLYQNSASTFYEQLYENFLSPKNTNICTYIKSAIQKASSKMLMKLAIFFKTSI